MIEMAGFWHEAACRNLQIEDILVKDQRNAKNLQDANLQNVGLDEVTDDAAETLVVLQPKHNSCTCKPSNSNDQFQMV